MKIDEEKGRCGREERRKKEMVNSPQRQKDWKTRMEGPALEHWRVSVLVWEPLVAATVDASD